MARWEPLGNGCGVYVTPEHGFTTDTLLLARFSQPGPEESCADVGTGCGTIPILWKSRGHRGPVLAVELSPEAAELARASAERSGFSGELRVLCGDARSFREAFPHQGPDRMVCNPPYYPTGRGAAAQGARGTARSDGAFTLEDLAAAAVWGLRYGGRLCLCLPAERLAEALTQLRAARLEPKRLRLVQSSPGKGAYLFLLECRYGGRPGLTVEPVLTINGEDGKPTPELDEIYGEFRKA